MHHECELGIIGLALATSQFEKKEIFRIASPWSQLSATPIPLISKNVMYFCGQKLAFQYQKKE